MGASPIGCSSLSGRRLEARRAGIQTQNLGSIAKGDFYLGHCNSLLLKKKGYASFNWKAESLGLAYEHGATGGPVQGLMAAWADQYFKQFSIHIKTPEMTVPWIVQFVAPTIL